MLRFVHKHADRIRGVLSGFDRLVLRGSLRALSYVGGMKAFLWDRQILLKDFGAFAEAATARVNADIEASAEGEGEGRPVIYLASAETNKEQVALRIAETDDIREGLVCVIKCVEPCVSFDIHRNRELEKFELVIRDCKCLFYYRYAIDPVFGWMNARVQTGLPVP